MFRTPGKKEYKRGCDLYKLKKYNEAEQLFRQAVNAREKHLGSDRVDTLNSKHWLGVALYKQTKYDEAEKWLQQAVDGRGRTLGRECKETLHSKHWLGVALYKQTKYKEAEKWLQQTVDGRQRTFSRDHENTLYSKQWLGLALYQQTKYDEAEKWLQQAVDGWETKFGPDDVGTIKFKYFLGLTFREQKRYNDAEKVLRQVADGQEKRLDSNYQNTLDTLRAIQELQRGSSSLSLSGSAAESTLCDRLSSFFLEGNDSRQSYTDSDISDIALLLKQSNPHWSKVPRTYIILRTIGQLDVLDELVDIGFSDYWFPVTGRNLPHCLRPSVRTAFFDAQRLVLTNSIDLENGDKGQHCYFNQGEALPLESKELLGSGGFGQVHRVLSLLSFKEYARKRVLRSSAFRGPRSEDMQQFIGEIQILKRVKHLHVVEFIGSYSDPKYIALIMSPVAEMDLSLYLKRANESSLPELRTFFGCLATALEYLHRERVRHKDIKPGNILVNRGTVLFADFGLSLDFTDASGNTTTGMVSGLSPRYCAPEVAQYQPRNTASDIWSLGVVFLEMIVVLKGMTAQYMNDFFSQRGSQQTFIRTNPDVLPEFIAELETVGDSSDNRALIWTQGMLSVEQKHRPTAPDLVTSILNTEYAGESTRFCGICCLPDEEDFSDLGDE